MKVLVCGGRSYDNMALVFATLHDLNYERKISAVIHGGATGADALADSWAEHQSIPRIACPANWELYGRKAGPLRNRQMLLHGPDLVIAFPGGRGTADMVKVARASGIEVREVL